MSDHNRSFFSLMNWGKLPRGKRPAPAAQLRLEQLEDRLVPTTLPAVDLTTAGAIGQINGAIFEQTNTQPTGCGVIHDFVRLQASNAKATIEQGFNTSARPLQFDENTSPTFTRNLQLSELPTANVGGTIYRTFLLGVNQKSSQPLLSLDELRLYASSSPNLTGYDTATQRLSGLNPIYDMGVGNWVKLDARLTHGNGSGDMLLYVPDALFASAGANPYVYLYSKFGVNYAGNAGFEQWAPGQASDTATNGTISGTVIDQSTGLPVADVVVFIDTSGTGVLTSSDVYAITDSSGHYTFTNLATGMGSFSTYKIDVASQDWTSATPEQTVDLSTQTTANNVNFQVFMTTPPSPPPAGAS